MKTTNTISIGDCAASYIDVEVIEGRVNDPLDADDLRWLLVADLFTGNAVKVPARTSEMEAAAALFTELANECDDYCEGCDSYAEEIMVFYAYARRSFGTVSRKLRTLARK